MKENKEETKQEKEYEFVLTPRRLKILLVTVILCLTTYFCANSALVDEALKNAAKWNESNWNGAHFSQ